MLEELQNSTSVGMGGFCWDRNKKYKGEIDPGWYATFTLRQVAQLSLRRLGKTPAQLPATQFNVRYGSYDRGPTYVAKKIDVPRAANAGKIKTGMTPEEVLDLIGEPDFAFWDGSPKEYWDKWDKYWEYDMDAPTPFTLLVHWDTSNVRNVARVEQKTPPLWQDGLTRDRKIFQHGSMGPGDRCVPLD